MLKKFASLTLAAVLAATLGACAPDREEGGGAGVAERGETPAERAAGMPSEWGTQLQGDKRNLAEGFTRAAWVQSNLAAGDWEQAGEDLNNIEEQVQDLRASDDVPQAVKDQLASLQPMINTLGNQIVQKDQMAMQTADKITEHFSMLMQHQQVVAWMQEERGGGAGRGMDK